MRTRTLGLLAGGLLATGTGAALIAPGFAGATTPPDDTTTESSDDTGTDLGAFEFGDRIRELLQPLVDEGVLTDEQVEAIVGQVEADVPNVIFDMPGLPGGPRFPGDHDEIIIAGPGFPGGGRHHHDRFGERLGRLEIVADTIGIDVSDLWQELRSGSTIADVAEANGVDPQTVIDALVADAEQHITDYVTGADDQDTESSTDGAETTETTSA